MKKFLFALTASFIFILGCSKDDDNDEPADAVTIQNLSGNYAWTGYSISSGSLTFNLFDSIPSCAKDDVINLKSDKTYTWPDSGEKCSGSTDQNGTWDLSGTTRFVWDGESFDIERFDGKDLEISISDTDPTSGQEVSFLFKFRKQ